MDTKQELLDELISLRDKCNDIALADHLHNIIDDLRFDIQCEEDEKPRDTSYEDQHRLRLKDLI